MVPAQLGFIGMAVVAKGLQVVWIVVIWSPVDMVNAQLPFSVDYGCCAEIS